MYQRRYKANDDVIIVILGLRVHVFTSPRVSDLEGGQQWVREKRFNQRLDDEPRTFENGF